MSISAFGTDSMDRDCRAYGSTLEQGRGCRAWWALGGADHETPRSATPRRAERRAAVLTALIHAKLTGKGQFIDLAQLESVIPFAAPWIIAHSIAARRPSNTATAIRSCAAWLLPLCRRRPLDLVAVSSDAMWPKLATCLGEPTGLGCRAETAGPGRQSKAISSRDLALDVGTRAG